MTTPRQTPSPAAREKLLASIREAIAAGRWPSPGPLWRPEEDALLGTAPDSQIAAALGRSSGSVRGRRHKLGIPSPTGPGRPVGWRKRINDGTPPDTDDCHA